MHIVDLYLFAWVGVLWSSVRLWLIFLTVLDSFFFALWRGDMARFVVYFHAPHALSLSEPSGRKPWVFQRKEVIFL
jgi:hypothetical protein